MEGSQTPSIEFLRADNYNQTNVGFSGLGAGDGLFARVDLPANTACAFYNGVRVKPGDKRVKKQVSLKFSFNENRPHFRR